MNFTPPAILNSPIKNPIWLTISEAAKIGGVNSKTIRRSIFSNSVKYKVTKNKYLIEMTSLIQYLNSNQKLQNKLKQYGIDQYINGWKE